MQVNKKKSIRLKNRTKYFNPDKDRTHVRFSSPDTYQNRQIKIEGYESRLYWQFRYCQDHDGQTFFYTLTYNDTALPKKYGMNCFDYEHLRDLLTGGFRKQLLRKYGTIFKYFVGAELGDGKGSRGMHNNPHYHILFFLEPANNPRFPYVKIDPKDFRHLVRLYWQNFDEDVTGYRDYNEAKYGIAKEGENNGLVTDFRACMYCAKYVCKDVKLKKNERIVLRNSKYYHRKCYKRKMCSYEDFFDDVINDLYNIPLTPKWSQEKIRKNPDLKIQWLYTPEQLVTEIIPDAFKTEDELGLDRNFELCKGVYALMIIHQEKLWDKYYAYCRSKVEEFAHEDLVEWRNRYSNKCRISHGVGDYALTKIEDKLNPYISVPSKRGFKRRPISMYYYRKLYCKVVKDKKGSNIYVLTQDGIDYKASRLQQQIKKMVSKTDANLNILLGNEELFNKMRESDVNTDVFLTYPKFLRNWNYLLNENNKEEILQHYAEYKLVYEDRFFSFDLDGGYQFIDFPVIDLDRDYRRFLVPSIYSVSRSDLRLDTFIKGDYKNYLPYSQHPYFLRYIGVFRVFDLIADYLFVQGDNKNQAEAEERAATKRFHSREKLKEFYSVFKR